MSSQAREGQTPAVAACRAARNLPDVSPMRCARHGPARNVYPLEQIRFRAVPVDLRPRDSGGYAEADARKTVADASANSFDRNLAAMGLSWRAARLLGEFLNTL